MRQLCAQTEHNRQQTMFPEACLSVKNNFNIDDYLNISATVEEETRKTQDFMKMLTKGGVTRTMFVSNVCGVFSFLH